MEEIASLWSYQQNIAELKQKLLYTTLELEAVKAENDEEIKRNSESIKRLLHTLKIVCQERDEAKDQVQKLLNKTMMIPNGFDQVRQHHQGALVMPTKANSSVTESNSLNHSSSPVDSLFDPTSSPEFSNINVETPFVQDYDQNGLVNVQKVDQATLVMEGMIKGKTLPQKGNLLEAVIEAGPLLQTLLLSGSLPKWRNPPSLKTFHVPSMAVAVDRITAAPELDARYQNKLLESPMMMLTQSQPFANMACGRSSQLMTGDGGNNGCVLGFGGSFDSNLGTIKKQRLH